MVNYRSEGRGWCGLARVRVSRRDLGRWDVAELASGVSCVCFMFFPPALLCFRCVMDYGNHVPNRMCCMYRVRRMLRKFDFVIRTVRGGVVLNGERKMLQHMMARMHGGD